MQVFFAYNGASAPHHELPATYGPCVDKYHLPLTGSHALTALSLSCAGYNAACNMAEEVSHCPTLQAACLSTLSFVRYFRCGVLA